MTTPILSRMTTELGISAPQISAVEKLLSEGSTVPFIARYRKEAHGNLDEVQIGKIQEGSPTTPSSRTARPQF